MGGIQKLKMQLERVTESTLAKYAELAHPEIQIIRLELEETLSLEEYIQSTFKIRSAYELAEHTKLEASQKEAELDSKLMKATKEIEGLKAELVAKETKLQSIFKENEGLSGDIEKNMWGESESPLEMEKKKFEVGLADLKASLLDKENELQCIKEENESMKFEIRKREVESNEAKDEALASAKSAKAAEREALMKLGAEEVEGAVGPVEEAAEAAVAMLSTGNNNGKYVERTGSLDYPTIGGKLGPPFSEDLDDESAKKKNSGVFKKIGVMLKKDQK
ncbi:hypothetical protein RHMOL_Rhmol05G0249800 [Rhododendron molle]|uniref:Uncharacterized protein n=1 Tax=Rhododendron molle TaxID=49168 RepID=A0ACC0NSN6_RHOML|nr:hypothetical protein RHMOL_Rhmol05G0249800 [Rhododendron molle]